MPYAIFRMKKRKGGSIPSMEAHNERKKEAYKSNPNIQPDKSKDNYHLVEPNHRYYHEVKSRIDATKCRVRKNSIKVVEVLMTATPEFLAKMSFEEQRAFFSRAVKFMQKEVGEQNVFVATVHMDEKTPHMHLCFTPITKDGRLSAKEILGYKDDLCKWQDRFYEYMHQAYPELERGEPARDTGRKHIPPHVFRKAEALDKQVAAIEKALTDISPFNASKKREQALELLRKWLPDAQQFTALANSTEGHIRALEKQSRFLWDKCSDKDSELYAQQEKLDASMAKIYALESTLRKQQRLIDRIPPEVLETLRVRQKGRER